MTLKRVISGAYGVGLDRVLGGPAWTESDRLQIAAKADQPVNEDVLNAMLQTLLADRFNLKFHVETRIGETLMLEVARNGPRLQAANAEPPSYNNGHGHLDARVLTMTQFAEILSRELKLPVVDHTGLTGAFRFTLGWNADTPRAGDPEDAAADRRFEMSAAIGRHLGLALKSRRMPVEMLVIDHAEKPTDN